MNSIHLNRCGWRSQELPPLMHVGREVEIDLHHNVLPRTARLKPDAEDLLNDAQAVTGSRFAVLPNEDIVLHAMTHLMFNDEMAARVSPDLQILG